MDGNPSSNPRTPHYRDRNPPVISHVAQIRQFTQWRCKPATLSGPFYQNARTLVETRSVSAKVRGIKLLLSVLRAAGTRIRIKLGDLLSIISPLASAKCVPPEHRRQKTVAGILSLLDSLRNAGVNTIVFFSSCASDNHARGYDLRRASIFRHGRSAHPTSFRHLVAKDVFARRHG